MKTKTILSMSLAGVALILVYNQRKKIMGEDPCYREGYFAGVLTPGPITILTLAGVIHFYG